MNSTTKESIRRWLNIGKENNATHVIIVCDTWDWDDYPVYVHPNEDPKEIASKYDNKDMQKIMEVYNLSLDFESQINEHRAFNY
jgi:hypothetical protein